MYCCKSECFSVQLLFLSFPRTVVRIRLPRQLSFTGIFCCRATHSYAIFYISLGVFVPLVVVLFCYASIFVRYWQVKRDIRSRRVVSMELRSNASVSAASLVGAAPDQSRLQVPLLSSRKTGGRSPNGEGSAFPSDPSSTTMSNYASAGSSAQLQHGGGTSKKGFTSDDIKLAKTLFTVFIVFLVCWQVKAVFRYYFICYYWLTNNWRIFTIVYKYS